MPSILFAHPSTELYGSDRQLAESVAGFVDAGWAVTVCLPRHGDLETLVHDARVEIVDFAVLRKGLLSAGGLVRLLTGLPGQLWRLVRVLRRLRPDVVYVNTVTVPWWVVAARLARIAVVVHVHEAEADLPKVLRLALNGPLLLADKVVANSSAARDVVVQTVPGLAARVTVVANGVRDPGAGADVAGGGLRLVVVARLSPRKGVDVALEALAAVRAAGTPATLQVCGTAFAGYEWFEQQLRRRAREADLDGAVVFRGYVDPTAAVLHESDVVLVPSRVEPFGNTAVEGLLAARPVVASDVQGLAEIITDGVTGLLVPPGDPAALAAAILRLCRDAGLARRLARTGRVEAEQRFSAARYRRDIVAEVDELVDASWSMRTGR